MKVTFIGADHEVTGSCTYIENKGKKFLVDYGMEQGRDVYENADLPVSPAEIDYVILTHAHIDHSGMLPKLYQQGFRGEIHGTAATCSLCDIMLRDSAHIQTFEAEWRNRKGRRQGKEDYVPVYTMEDAVGAIGLLVPHEYDARFALCSGTEVRFTDAGHLLGSASLEIWLEEDGFAKKIVFSGDIGNINQPLIRDPQLIGQADYVVMESTYGDRLHNPPPDYAASLAGVLQTTFDRSGSVIIPSFAVGRTQEILYFIRKIKADCMVKGHDGFTVYVDSPLAIEATEIFNRNSGSCFDREAKALLAQGINPISFPGLKVAVSADESIAINFDQSPKVILSASGMCDAGRIKHHLKHNLWRRENTVLFVGYQAANTLGRALVEGAKEVKLFGEEIKVAAEIKELPGISGHGDQKQLIRWVSSFQPKPAMVFINHGESTVCDSFAKKLHDEYGFATYAPYSGAVYDLARNRLVEDRGPMPIHKQQKKTGSPAYLRAMGAAERLYELLKKSEGCANKDLAKLADQINSMCDKWER